MVCRLLGNALFKILVRWGEKPPKCSQCRKAMQKEPNPRLFLLPVFHDALYTPSEEYYMKHCSPVSRVEEIPTGQRACRFWKFTCTQCGKRSMVVEDFLRVRDTEVVEMRQNYEYEIFAQFLNSTGNEMMPEQQTSVIGKEAGSRNPCMREE